MRVEQREVRVAGPHERAQFLDGLAREESSDPLVVAFACQLAEGLAPNDQADAIFRFVHGSIAYGEDPDGRETFERAKVTLERGWGDCDAKALAFVALCRAAGLDARTRPIIVASDGGPDFVHVQGEVRLPTHAAADAEGWVVAETIGEDLRLGEGTEAIPDRAPREV